MATSNFIQEMLLIQGPSIFVLYKEISRIALIFSMPCFVLALLFEYLGNMEFLNVVKKLLLILIFMGVFQDVHQKATQLSFEVANKTLKKVSPRNIFVKKWHEGKLKTKANNDWSWIEKLAIPNLNDLLATAFFLLAKIFIWVLKLIYSTVYHLTYVFSGLTALLFFFPSTARSIVGTIHSSLWCVIMPFVIVAILCLIGNTIDESALKGELALVKIENIIWLFGITLILLLSPLITFALINGAGIASAGANMGQMMTKHGLNILRNTPHYAHMAVSYQKDLTARVQNFRRKNNDKV